MYKQVFILFLFFTLIGSLFAQKHPIAFATKAELLKVKDGLVGNQLLQKSYNEIKKLVDKWIDKDIDVPFPKDKMILYNVNTKRRRLFNFPSDIFNEPEILNRIKIKKLTEKQLVINYETEKRSKTKMYSR